MVWLVAVLARSGEICVGGRFSEGLGDLGVRFQHGWICLVAAVLWGGYIRFTF